LIKGLILIFNLKMFYKISHDQDKNNKI